MPECETLHQVGRTVVVMSIFIFVPCSFCFLISALNMSFTLRALSLLIPIRCGRKVSEDSLCNTPRHHAIIRSVRTDCIGDAFEPQSVAYGLQGRVEDDLFGGNWVFDSTHALLGFSHRRLRSSRASQSNARGLSRSISVELRNRSTYGECAEENRLLSLMSLSRLFWWELYSQRLLVQAVIHSIADR